MAARTQRTWEQAADVVDGRTRRRVAAEYAHQREVERAPVLPGHHRACGCPACRRGRRVR